MIAIRSTSMRKSGCESRVTPIMVLVGGCAEFSGRFTSRRAFLQRIDVEGEDPADDDIVPQVAPAAFS